MPVTVEFAPTIKEAVVPKKLVQLCAVCGTPICEIDKVCENTACQALGRKILTSLEKVAAGFITSRTQKALGYSVLARLGVLFTAKPFYLVAEKSDIPSVVDAWGANYKQTQFVRPCPARPRHGFVESRPMKALTVDGLTEVLAEAQAVDPQAELLIVPFVEGAQANMVITPTRLAVGDGHDGATAGKAGTVELPLLGVPFAELTPFVLEAARVGSTEAPYVEVVQWPESMGGSWVFTQLRAGPKLDSSLEYDYIPERVEVKEILTASGDLVEWEAQMTTIKPGTVVVMLGGTLVSHYGVHCLINRIPVMTSRIPRVGEVLEESEKVLRAPDPAAVVRGLNIGMAIPIGQASSPSPDALVKLLIVVLHNAPAMSNGHGVWLGIAAASMFRLGMAASHGEARHKVNKTMKRESVFSSVFKDTFGFRSKLGYAQWLFEHGSWSGGYGGTKWGACTASVLVLDECIRTLIQEQTDENVLALTQALNNSVNQAHHNGWWLNKFTLSNSPFDDAARQSLNAIVAAGSTALQLRRYLRSEPTLFSWTEQWAKEAAIEVKDLELIPPETVEDEDDETDDDDYGDSDGGDDDQNDGDIVEPVPMPHEQINPVIVGKCECDYCKAFDSGSLTVELKAVATHAVHAETQPKASKVTFNPSVHVIEKAHVRWERYSATRIHGHLQFLLEGNLYCSDDIGFDLPADEMDKFVDAVINGSPKEVSYSSDSGGYMALLPGEHGWYDSADVIGLQMTNPVKVAYMGFNDVAYSVVS